MVTFDERVWQEYDGHKAYGDGDDEEFAEYIISTAIGELRRLSENDSIDFDLSDEEIDEIVTETLK